MTTSIKKKLVSWYNVICGQNEGYDFSDIFFLNTLLLAILVSMIATLSNIYLNLNIEMIVLTGIATFFYLSLFFLARYLELIKYSVALFIGSLFIIVNLLWFYNSGSFGPTLLIFQGIFALFLFFGSDIYQKTIIPLFAINITILFIIEYHFPDLIIPYNSHNERLIDIYIIAMIFFLCEIPLIVFAQKNYIKEKEKAEASEKIKSAFLANMSHEIRTPMNAIIGFSDLLRESNISEDEKDQYLEIIKENGNVLLNILNNVMDLSKLEANLVDIKEAPFRPFKLIQQLHLSFNKSLRKDNRVQLEVYIPDDKIDVTMFADELMIYQVFSNLISNSIKYTPKGFIRFGYNIDPTINEIIFFVQDSGIGIPKDKVHSIFERFSQAEEGFNREFSGAGLGLAISKGLIDLMNGHMWVESVLGKGSTFYFSIPMKKAIMPELSINGPSLN